MSLFETQLNPNPSPDREQVLAAPRFGLQFTDHMARASWSSASGWSSPRVEPYAPLALDPASAILHYAQGVFEGLKAYRREDGTIRSFRPDQNARRFNRSGARLALPELPEEWFLESLSALVAADEAWVPSDGRASLYLRPFMFASEPAMPVRPSNLVEYAVIASVAGDYFSGGVAPVTIWVSREATRAAPGGTGAAKCGGNYAASLLAQQEAEANGAAQVLFLDATERTYVEELGGMNVFLVRDDGTIVTPELSGSILAGITRDSVIQLARDLGHTVEERRIPLQEWYDDAAAGRITEAFACGTAAVITPIGKLVDAEGEHPIGDGNAPLAMTLRDALVDLQFGRREDPHGWMQTLWSPQA